MKIKSLAMLVCSGLIAATVAYVTPALADDTTDNQSSQSSSDQSQSNTDQSQSNGDSNGSSSDATTPDAASSDDDY